MPSDKIPRWTKPTPSFDIDDGVMDLLKAGLLRLDFQGDPFLTARCYLGRAIAIAMDAECKRKSAPGRRAKLKRLGERARILGKRLQKLAEEAEILLSMPSEMGAGTPEPKIELERQEAAACIRLPLLSSSNRRSAVGDVRKLENALREHRRNIPQQTDEAFRSAFIEEMVYCWVRLTAKIPSRGHADKFVAFVAAAHVTLGSIGRAHLALPFHIDDWDPSQERARSGKIGDDWSGQVDKTLKRINRRPEYDRGDRYERRYVPPTVGVQPASVRRQFGATQADFDHETRRLNKLMLDGSVEAAQILWCENQLAEQKLRNHFFHSMEFGFNAAEAGALIWPEGRYLVQAASSSP